jgi:glucosylceramidase
MYCHKNILHFIILIGLISISAQCNKNGNGGSTPTPPPTPPLITNDIDAWQTTANQSSLLQKKNTTIGFSTTSNFYPNIEVDSTITYQTIDGFGYCLTGGSAYLLNHMDVASRSSVLNELFGRADNSIGVSYLRVSIGSSDLDASVFSYNDLPAGQTDIDQTKFSIAPDKVNLIPVLKEILAINPDIKILGSPWSPPLWMKDNNNSIGGSLKPEYYASYAKYFVKYIQAMKAEGIPIDAITLQNEPLFGGNNPSMVMQAIDEARFIKNFLGPAFQAAGITTKIIVYDHNCDRPDYPITILNDPAAAQYVEGSAFHLYGGDVSAMTTVHSAHPDKNLYFTEQWTGSKETFDGDLLWHIKNVIIGTMNNWSKVALEWNLANDPGFGPHTPGGCSECKGALTISGSTFSRNVSYYIVAHASKFVPTGSKRIFSSSSTTLPNVAFLTPSGKKVMIVLNEGAATNFNIKYNAKWAVVPINASSVLTLIW